MRIMKPFNPELAMEPPKTCDYWKWTVLQAFIKKHCLQSCLCDGCMLGIVDDDGRPLRKSWQIMSTLPLPGLNGRTCDGTHEHGQSGGHSLKDAESYSYHMTDAIHRDWKQHVAKTTDRVVSQRKSFALCCLAGSNPTPVTTVATSAERTRAFWQDIMWSAVLSEAFQAGCGDDEFEKAVRPFYANVNPHTALAASIDHLRLPGSSRLSAIANAGLSEIQPDASRGRVRYLVLVTDSFSVFLAGKRSSVDLAGDLVEQVATGGDDELRGGHLQAPLGQNPAPCRPGPGRDCRIVGGDQERTLCFHGRDRHCGSLARQRAGGREGAVPESCLRTLEGKQYGPHYAAGDWREIADRVCTSIGELAALRGRPEFGDAVGVITLLGQPDPLRYALPHQFDECMKKFFGYARSLGVKTISVARIKDSIPMYDAFHFREDSSQRKKLTEHIGHHMRVLIAEHIASKVMESRFEEIHRRYPYLDKGKTFIPVIYQRAIGDAEAAKRASKVKAELATLDPWDPEFWATKEEATLSEMRYRFAPQEVVNLQMRRMVYMG